jgi:lysyl-tRNA synthetase class 2
LDSNLSCGKLLDKLFSHLVEPELRQPTFVMDHPQVESPLAKGHREKPFVAERFELFVGGTESI